MQDLNNQIAAVQIELADLGRVRKYLLFLRQQIVSKKEELANLEASVAEEWKDVEALEKKKRTLLANWVKNRYDEQLEQEKSEYLEALLTHRAREKDLQLLAYEEQLMSEKMGAEEQLQQDLRKLIQLRERQILESQESQDLLKINAQIILNIQYLEDTQVMRDQCLDMEVIVEDLVAEIKQMETSSSLSYMGEEDRLKMIMRSLEKANTLLLKIKLQLEVLQTKLDDWLKILEVVESVRQALSFQQQVLREQFQRLESFFEQMEALYHPETDLIGRVSTEAIHLRRTLEVISKELDYERTAFNQQGKRLKIQKERLLMS